MYYVDNLINLDDKDNPFLNILEKDSMFLNPSLGKFIDINYYNIKLENDFGIIFEQLESENNLKVNSIQHNYMLNNYPEDYSTNDINLITVKIQFSEHSEIYRRVYVKLQNVFAEVSAIFKVFTIIGKIMVDKFSKRLFFTDFINEYFNNHYEKKAKNENLSKIDLKKAFKKENSLKNIEISKSIPDNSLILNNISIKKNLDDSINKIEKIDQSEFINIPLQSINPINENKNATLIVPDNDNSLLNISEKRNLKHSEDNLHFNDLNNISSKNLFRETPINEQSNNINEKEKLDEEKIKNDLNKSIELSDINKKNTLKNLLNTNIKSKKENITCQKASLLSNILPKIFLSKNDLENENKFQTFFKKIENIFEINKVLSTQKSIDLIIKLFFEEEQIKALEYIRFKYSHCDNLISTKEDIESIENYFCSKNVLSNMDERILNLLIIN